MIEELLAISAFLFFLSVLFIAIVDWRTKKSGPKIAAPIEREEWLIIAHPVTQDEAAGPE